MENADMPAMPLHEYEVWADPANTDLGTVDATGLTKLEHASIELMKKLNSGDYNSLLDMANDAIAEAEALFEALEKRP